MRIIDEELLASFSGAGRCEFCGKASQQRHAHHVHSRGSGRLDIAINIVSLCPMCHADAHAGVTTRYEFLAIIAVREGIMQDAIVAEIHRLRRADKDGNEPKRPKRGEP